MPWSGSYSISEVELRPGEIVLKANVSGTSLEQSMRLSSRVCHELPA